MKIIIKHDQWTKPVGHFMSPMLDIGFRNQNIKETILYFNNEEEITDLYNRYKYDIQNDWDTEELPTIQEFLYSEHIYILLGCVDGEGHEVLYS
jgi:hypothetical protein